MKLKDTYALEGKLLSSVQLFGTPWTVAYQAPPSMGFSRQEYWSGLPFPSPGDLPNPGIEPKSEIKPGSPAFQADALTSEPPGKLTPWKTNLHSIFKSRDITLPTKVYLVKALVFLVVTYECESWTKKKAEHWMIGAFELWSWRRLLRVPWTARKSNQSILKEISPEYSLEGLMLKLKLQCFDHLVQRTNSFEKTLMLGMIEDGRRRG